MATNETYREAQYRVFDAVRKALNLPDGLAYKRIELSIGIGEPPKLEVSIDPLYSPEFKQVRQPPIEPRCE